MLKVVIDTNCWVQALPKRSSAHWLYQSVIQGKIEIVVSTEILLEYAEILGRFYTPEVADFFLKLLTNLPNLHRNVIDFKWNLIIQDLDDNKFVDCALNAGADLIVTEDRHFNVLAEVTFPKITAENLANFKQRLIEMEIFPE